MGIEIEDLHRREAPQEYGGSDSKNPGNVRGSKARKNDESQMESGIREKINSLDNCLIRSTVPLRKASCRRSRFLDPQTNTKNPKETEMKTVGTEMPCP